MNHHTDAPTVHTHLTVRSRPDGGQGERRRARARNLHATAKLPFAHSRAPIRDASLVRPLQPPPLQSQPPPRYTTAACPSQPQWAHALHLQHLLAKSPTRLRLRRQQRQWLPPTDAEPPQRLLPLQP